MSHFTVAVFMSEDHQSVVDLLAPYDENIQVTPYIRFTKAELIQQERDQLRRLYYAQYAEWRKDPIAYEKKHDNPDHIAYLKTVPQQLSLTDEDLYLKAIEGYEKESLTEDGDLLSTYNPNSKWDWYQIGGRWQGMLILKNEENGFRGSPGLMTEMSDDYDAAFVPDIDFEAMRQQAAAKLKPYEEAMTKSYMKEEYMRARFPTEEEYIKRNTAFSTYAVITPDGKWHAPGEMGWWGMSSDAPADERDWEANYYDRFIKPAIENNWYMVIVDCHI